MAAQDVYKKGGRVETIKQQPTMHQDELQSVSALSLIFRRGYAATKKRLADVPPDGLIKGNKAWFIVTASTVLHPDNPHGNTKANSGPGHQGGGADSFKNPKDRLDYVKSERELMKFREETGQLIPEDVHREALATLVKLLVTGVELLPDQLERSTGLNPEQAKLVQAECDKLRERLYTQNAELTTD